MSSVAPSPSVVLEVFDTLGPPGTPVTTTEVAEKFDCTARTIYNKLEILVDEETLETKKVGARGRVWWQPLDTIPVETVVSFSDRGRSETRNSSQEEICSPELTGKEYIYSEIFNQVFQFIGLLDPDGTLLEANEAALSFGGFDREDVIGEPFWEAPWWQISEQTQTRLKTAIHRAADGEFVRYEVEVQGAERTAVIDFSLRPVTDDQGNVTFLIPEGRDITDLKQREHRLESELTEIFDRISDGFIGLDEQFRFTYVNEHAESLLEITESSVMNRDIRTVIELTEPFQAALQEAVAEQNPVFLEDYYEPFDMWFENAIYPSETGVSFYFRDITERKQREQQLEQYRTMVETVTDGIIVVDTEFQIRAVNKALVEMTNYPHKKLVGAPASLIRPDDLSPSMSRVQASLNAGTKTESVETMIQPADDDPFPSLTHFSRITLDDGTHGRVGVIRDISDRVERERELRDRVRQQEIVAELGKHALEGGDLDRLMSEAVDLVAEALGNDYCKVLELDTDAEELLLRHGIGWDEGIVGSVTVSSVEDESQAAYTLATYKPVTVEDFDTETRFSGPTLLTNHSVRSGISTIIGSHDNPWGILGTHDTEPAEISEYDVNFVQSVANILATAINRHEREQTVHYQREQLAELNSINEVVQEITTAVIDQSTREEIERIVCNCLAEADPYKFAWIADIDTYSKTLTPRAEAGIEGYLDEVTISVLPDDPRGQGPAGKAIQTGAMQVIQDTMANPNFEPWHEYAERYGYRSVAAIPISYDGTLYGLLGVYAARPAAFSGRVREVITQLGEIVGHAIAATERKQALMSPEVTEIQFVVPDILDTMDICSDCTGTIRFNRAVPIGDDTFLEYGTVDEAAIETLQAIGDHYPNAEELTITTFEDGAIPQFEMRVTEPPITSNIASRGGKLQQTQIENGDLNMTIHLPTTVAAREITDVIHEIYPTAYLLTRRQIKRSEDIFPQVYQTYTDDLTERQRSALETAFCSGFFEWPRNASGEDIADSLGVSPPTFHQHIRLAQKKVFESLLLYPSTEE